MPRRSQVIAQVLRYSLRYAPLIYEGYRRTRRPSAVVAETRVSRRTARTIAFEHAAHLVDGSVLPVYDGDLRVWVVFSGDQVVGTHPVVNTPISELLPYYDLGKRVRPTTASQAAPPTAILRQSMRALPRPPRND